MDKTIDYKGKTYKATVSEWTSGESTATIKIGKNEILLHWRRYTDRDGGEWYKKDPGQ